MTDGILLAEMQRDRDLRRYDTIIIDEAHERSLNIDFLLGYLKQLLPRRPDLKVIITSATIDPQRFADALRRPTSAAGVPVPVIEVSGRTYPVEVRYRPLVERADRPDGGAERDQVTGVVEAVEELWTEARAEAGASDILVFLSGEREIRDAADALNALKLPATEVLPLFARLSAAEQHRVFSPHERAPDRAGHQRRRDLADRPGHPLRRRHRHGAHLALQPAHQGPAAARSSRSARPAPTSASGRCGRRRRRHLHPPVRRGGLRRRPEFTEPEILRTNLASVILQMTSLGLGDVARFPFVDPPDSRQIADGVRLLEELRAFATRTTARRGRRRGARTPAHGIRAHRWRGCRSTRGSGGWSSRPDRLGCLREVLVIVAALSIQDPRERPRRQAGAQADAVARAVRGRATPTSSRCLNLWPTSRSSRKRCRSSAFRRMCKAEFLHYLRIREWQDLHSQLRQACQARRGIDPDRGDRRARRRARPGHHPPGAARRPALARRRPRRGRSASTPARAARGSASSRVGAVPQAARSSSWPAELVETSRLWARVNAAHRPGVGRGGRRAPRQAAVLSEPRWSAQAGARRRHRAGHALRGAARRRPDGRVRPDRRRELARDLFIRHALVEGDWDTAARLLPATTPPSSSGSPSSRSGPGGATSSSTTRRCIAFYDKRIPPDVRLGRHFDSWWKKAAAPDAGPADLHRGPAPARERGRAGRRRRLPDDLAAGRPRPRRHLPVRAGRAAQDGVTVHVPVEPCSTR